MKFCIFFIFLSVSILYGGYGDMSAFNYFAFDNRNKWYVEEEDLRQIWLDTYAKYSGLLLDKGAEGVDLASRIYDKLHPADYDQVMLLLPWWDYEYINRSKSKFRFGKNEIRFEIKVAAMDGSIIAKFDAKGESVKWKTALKKAINSTFEKLVFHYSGYDPSRKYSFPEFEKRFSGLEVLPDFDRAKTLDYFNNNNAFKPIEGIWKSLDYFGRVPAEFAIFYLSKKDSYAIVNITQDLFGLKQGTVIGEFTPYGDNVFNGYFVDCLTGKFTVGLSFVQDVAVISQLTTRETPQKQWHLKKVYSPNNHSRIVSARPNADTKNNGHTSMTYLGQGSGYQVPNSKIIFTNNHVVENAQRIVVNFNMSAHSLEANVLMRDEANDLAILEVERDLPVTPKICIDVSLKLGDKLSVFGFPDIKSLGKGIKYTEGIINSTAGLDKASWLQMNAEIYPGSSGGPVFNENGALVGISVAGIDDYSNVNYAVKAAYLIAIFEQYGVPYSIGESTETLNIDEMSKNVCLIKCYGEN